MRVPGSNILRAAFKAIAQQGFQYYAFDYRTPNAIGLDVAYYQPPINKTGSVQPVARVLYAQMGLDLQKNYYNVFLPNDVLDIARDVSGDQIQYQNLRLQCISKTAWFGVDGWDQVLCVEVPCEILTLSPACTLDNNNTG